MSSEESEIIEPEMIAGNPETRADSSESALSDLLSTAIDRVEFLDGKQTRAKERNDNNIADIKDSNDPQGRTYRQVNNATPHKYGIGVLVELDNGARLFTAKQTRDCDGTPLYSLTPESGTDENNCPLNEMYWTHGYPEEILKLIKCSNMTMINRRNFQA